METTKPTTAYTPIKYGPSSPTSKQSSTVIPAGANSNPRSDKKGALVDKSVRKKVASKTGRDAVHRHPLAGGHDPADIQNIYQGNRTQNRQSRVLIDNQRSRLKKADPALEVRETSKLYLDPSRPGYGKNTPIGEKISRSYTKDGKELYKQDHYLVNTRSSAGRYADAQRASGKPVGTGEIARLDKLDKSRFAAQGHATAAQAQKQTAALRATGTPGVFGPKLATNQGKTTPNFAASQKREAATRIARAPEKPKTPQTPTRTR